jgi:Putative metal-binding motif
MQRLHLRPAGETNRSRKLRTQWLAAALSACWTLPAAARSAGSETDNCTGCHTTASDATAMLVASPADFSPGATVDFTLTVSRPNLGSAGYYIATDIGTLTPGAGSRLGTFGMSLLHNAPVAAVGGTSTVHFQWQAPAEPGGVDVKVTAVAANGDGRSSGDAAFDQTFSFVYGCTGVPVFQDLDGDQVGSSEYGVSLRCGTEAGWAELDGDCNENNAEIHPGAAEICNGKDDNCDGETDEGIDLATLYRDADGDGFGTGESVGASGGCDNSGEFAAQNGDCDDADPEVFPDATEQCNETDDNCDGRIDERVRPRCGVGRCESLSISCLSEDCVPGSPSPEKRRRSSAQPVKFVWQVPAAAQQPRRSARRRARPAQ